MIALGGVCLIGVAFGAHALLRIPSETQTGQTRRVLVRCVDPKCGYEGTVPMQSHEVRFPVQCPKCKQFSCQKLWECRDCGNRFVPTGGPGELQCRECGSRRVGTAQEPGPPPKPE